MLVNNAGILRDKSFLKMDEAMWDVVIAVHLKGTFLCRRRSRKQIVAQGGGGRIVNTTSVSGMLGNFGQANYAAAKAGIYGLTRTMSIELQKHRITVNALAPIAKTRMTEDLPMFQGVDTMTAEHISPAALFLASDLCGRQDRPRARRRRLAHVRVQGGRDARQVQGRRRRRVDGARDRRELGRDHQGLRPETPRDGASSRPAVGRLERRRAPGVPPAMAILATAERNLPVSVRVGECMGRCWAHGAMLRSNLRGPAFPGMRAVRQVGR